MKLKNYNLDKHERRTIASPGLCIYCCRSLAPNELTDEHIIPYALGHNTLIFKKASCKTCARIIQPYEQSVLRKQLGNFRLQVDAPSRTKKKGRPDVRDIQFIEVDDEATFVRDLGVRTFKIDDAPLTLNLWLLPEARILREDASPGDDQGRPWSYNEPRAYEICREVAEETGAINVAMKTGDMSRNDFLRFLAKTAHAYAVGELGIDGFKPVLNDIILNEDDDISRYVGGTSPQEGREDSVADTVFLSIGSADNIVAVMVQFYLALQTPAYAVVIGEKNGNTEARIKAMIERYE